MNTESTELERLMVEADYESRHAMGAIAWVVLAFIAFWVIGAICLGVLFS